MVTVAACGGGPLSTAGHSGRRDTTTTAVPSTSPIPGASSSTTAPAIPSCTTAQLALSFGGSTGAGGTSYSTYYLADSGGTTCSLEGYPGVAVLDAGGNIVQHPATRGALGTHGPVPVTVVVLHPGQRASFLLTSVNNVPNPDCPSEYSGTTLQVYPPNQTSALRQPFSGGFCDLGVGPVQAS